MDWRSGCLNKRVYNRPIFTIGDRGAGKTLRLIKQAADTHGVIVCPSRHMAVYTFRMAQDLGYSIIHPITYDELFTYSNGKRNTDYYFDEYGIRLESIIQRIINGFERDRVENVIIDKESISYLNDILGGLKVCDMDGKKLRLKIKLCEED